MVGHDIRNPLQAIVGDLYIARQETADMPENETKKAMVETLEGIEENIFYINKIVTDLQDYARPINPRAQETDIKTIIYQSFANSKVPDNVKTGVKVDSDAEKIMADADSEAYHE